jgi:L-glyceraldehyde 3-phosphate reductase
MLERRPEQEIFPLNKEKGVGVISFSPLAQGLLTNKYINGIPADSRVRKGVGFLTEEHLTPALMEKVRALDSLAQNRSQSLAGMALAWVLNNKNVTSVIVGTSSVRQLNDNIKALESADFTNKEIEKINEIL